MNENPDFGANGHTGDKVKQILFNNELLKGLYQLAKDAVKNMEGHVFVPVPMSHFQVPGLQEIATELFGDDLGNIHPIRPVIAEEQTISGFVHVSFKYQDSEGNGDGHKIHLLDPHLLIPS